jgi:hypothetical protein
MDCSDAIAVILLVGFWVILFTDKCLWGVCNCKRH